jgi:hypothetical protein
MVQRYPNTIEELRDSLYDGLVDNDGSLESYIPPIPGQAPGPGKPFDDFFDPEIQYYLPTGGYDPGIFDPDPFDPVTQNYSRSPQTVEELRDSLYEGLLDPVTQEYIPTGGYDPGRSQTVEELRDYLYEGLLDPGRRQTVEELRDALYEGLLDNDGSLDPMGSQFDFLEEIIDPQGGERGGGPGVQVEPWLESYIPPIPGRAPGPEPDPEPEVIIGDAPDQESGTGVQDDPLMSVYDPDRYRGIFAKHLGIPDYGRSQFQQWLADQWKKISAEYALRGQGILGGFEYDPRKLEPDEPPSFGQYLATREGPWGRMTNAWTAAPAGIQKSQPLATTTTGKTALEVLTEMSPEKEIMFWEAITNVGLKPEDIQREVFEEALEGQYPNFIASNIADRAFSNITKDAYELSPGKLNVEVGYTSFLNFLRNQFDI